MWKKGSYDVSNGRQQESFNQLNVFISENRNGGFIIKIQKSAESARSRLQTIYNGLRRISGIKENLVVFLAVFFLIISVLIGVIIWLSVSVHLISISNIHTASILDELILSSSSGTKEKSSDIVSSTEFTATASINNPDQATKCFLETSQMEILKDFLKFTIYLKEIQSAEGKDSLILDGFRLGKSSATKSTTSESFLITTIKGEQIEVSVCDCKRIVPASDKKADEKNLSTKNFTQESSDETNSDEDNSGEDNEGSRNYLSVQNSILTILNVPIIIKRCDQKKISNLETDAR